MRPIAVLRIALAALAAAALAGCEGGARPRQPASQGQSQDPRAADLPPLPDLESMAPAVREQIDGQRALLESTMRSPSASDGDIARELGSMGQLLLAAEAASAARPFLLRAAQFEPAEPRWQYYLGHLHRMLGEIDSAAHYFEVTLMLRPESVAAGVWLANMQLAQGQLDEATASYARALERQPRMFAALFGLGRAAAARGNFTGAVEHFEAALRAQPNASAVHYPLAIAYRELGRAAAAEAHLQRRGDLDPGPPDPMMEELAGILRSAVVQERLGDRALARGDFKAAASSFRRGLDLEPDHVAMKQKLATALALTGDTSSAVALYEQLLRQNPGFAEAHYSLGALFLGSGRPDLALPRFAAAVKADPDYLHARLQLAHTLRRLGRLDAALVEYQGALGVDSRLADARFGYAVSLAGLGRWGAARAWLMEGRRSHPDRPEFTEALARLLAAAPDASVRDEPAALDLAQGLASSSRSWRALETMAMALAATSQYPEAAARQREAIDAYRAETGGSSAVMLENLKRYERRARALGPWSVDPIG